MGTGVDSFTPASTHLPPFCILLFFVSPFVAMGLSIFEFIAHYHMDWFKMWYNRKKEWKCNTHNEFWVLTGIDQYVHAITYLAIALIVG
jgi:hypothetical protein